MINIFEKFHSICYSYNDLKPDNVCIGEYSQIDPKYLKLIDFGLSTKFLNEDGTHIKQNTLRHFGGNMLLSSLN